MLVLIDNYDSFTYNLVQRLGEIDRTREMARICRDATAPDRERLTAQLRILMSRARLLRAAIATACTSVLLAALLVIVLFVGAVLGLALTAPVVGGLFIACMTGLIASLVLYLGDVNRSLGALKLEIEAALQ